LEVEGNRSAGGCLISEVRTLISSFHRPLSFANPLSVPKKGWIFDFEPCAFFPAEGRFILTLSSEYSMAFYGVPFPTDILKHARSIIDANRYRQRG